MYFNFSHSFYRYIKMFQNKNVANSSENFWIRSLIRRLADSNLKFSTGFVLFTKMVQIGLKLMKICNWYSGMVQCLYLGKKASFFTFDRFYKKDDELKFWKNAQLVLKSFHILLINEEICCLHLNRFYCFTFDIIFYYVNTVTPGIIKNPSHSSLMFLG